ncbi:MAG TPA: DUF6065 family protein [Caulobacteraceae bacterium]|nr:DUF6065 family protein [Caulobacteraceae bacterium]
MARAKVAKTKTEAVETLGPPGLTCFPMWPDPPALVPAKQDREWMDQTPEHFAYRCIPLSIANASGWELILPFSFEAAWYGGQGMDTIQFRSGDHRVQHMVTSHFGSGVITFHTGWLFKTPPGWAVWVRGAPNTGKDGIVALDGLVETDWLPFPFTMNWRFLKPGVVRFEAGEPFAFITLVPHAQLDAVQPEVRSLDTDPELKKAFGEWAASRADFSARLKAREASAVAEKWQRTYVRADTGAGEGPMFHLAKRRLKAPK